MKTHERNSEPQRVYDRAGRIYDIMEAPMDRMGGTERRRRVLSNAKGRVLEVGIGTARRADDLPHGSL